MNKSKLLNTVAEPDESEINTEENEKAFPRVETLSEKQIISLAQNHCFVSAVEIGESIQEGLKLTERQFPGFKRTVRWGQKLYNSYKKQGVEALLDGRLKNENQNKILTPAIQKIILSWWYSRPGAGSKEIWRKVLGQCKERELPKPAYITVQKFLQNQSEANKLARAGKIKVWDKQGRPVIRFNLTSYSNQRWQIDHTRLDIWVRVWVVNHWEPSEAWLTVVLDAHSRSVAGFVISLKNPDAWTTATLLRKAVLPKENSEWFNRGLPSILQPDRGRDFMSHAVQASVAGLGIIFDPDPPYYPNRKGRIERFFLTLDSHLRILQGHHKAIGCSLGAAQKKCAVLLTRNQLQSEIEHWIVNEYHQRENSETKRKPVELWEETVQMRTPENINALDSMLLKSDKLRKIRHTGIDFHIGGKSDERGGRYWSPDLVSYWKAQVRIRYNPEDLESILVYLAATNEYLGEAWLMKSKDARYSIIDIKRTRNQARRGLLERVKTYSQEIHQQDRRAAKQENFRKAREIEQAVVKQIETLKPEAEIGNLIESGTANRMSKVEALMNKMDKKDRGAL